MLTGIKEHGGSGEQNDRTLEQLLGKLLDSADGQVALVQDCHVAVDVDNVFGAKLHINL